MTISEIVIVLVIVAILLLIAIPQFTRPNLQALTVPDSLVAPSASGPVSVRVTSRTGTPQRGVSVRFETEGRGSVEPGEVRTDTAGVASTVWHAAPDSGALTIRVRPAGRAQPEVVLRTRVRGQAAAPTPHP
jgi:hypothetical protein